MPSARAWAGPWICDRLAVEPDRAAVGLVDAGEDLDERALAGAVLADEARGPRPDAGRARRRRAPGSRRTASRSRAARRAAAHAVAGRRGSAVTAGSSASRARRRRRGVVVGRSGGRRCRALAGSRPSPRAPARRSGRRRSRRSGRTSRTPRAPTSCCRRCAMTSRAAATIERLIWASSSVASAQAGLEREAGGAEERLLDVDPAEQPVAELADDRQRLPADAAAEHQHGDPADARRAPRRAAARW